MRILLIEDEKITRITLSNTLKKEGYEVVSSESGQEGLELFRKQPFDVVITDLRLPRISGLEVLKEVKERAPDCTVIMMTAYGTVETAVEALKMGAYDYITKPFSPDKLLSMLQHLQQFHKVLDENVRLKKRLKLFENRVIVGNSPPMRRLLETIRHVARHDYTVLIQGESGTGKELVARALHYHSARRDKPFVPINCAVIPETLLESELFGHEKGAFSGAIRRHIGYFERANGGTLFIDDIDDLPMPLQVKLLRVLQEREFHRVGGTEAVQVDVRVIAATKIDLQERVAQNRFREDLYYRLNIIPIQVPPLRERKEDIPALFEHFLEKHGAPEKIKQVPPELLQRFMEYDWPGNVRELENMVERFIALSDMKSLDIQTLLPGMAALSPEREVAEVEEKTYPPFQQFIDDKEREIIRWALRRAGNNVSRAAELLRIPRSTLRSKMARLGMAKEMFSN